jgi:hypothetical protein
MEHGIRTSGDPANACSGADADPAGWPVYFITIYEINLKIING